MWLFVLVVLVYCFTLGFTHKYKEIALEEREKRIKQQDSFNSELGAVLTENADLRDELRSKMFN